jgi:hypothetical protein
VSAEDPEEAQDRERAAEEGLGRDLASELSPAGMAEGCPGSRRGLFSAVPAGLSLGGGVLLHALNRLPKNSGPGRKDVPQGLKPDVFFIVYGPTKVVP